MSDEITKDKYRKMNAEIEKAANAMLESSFAAPVGSALAVIETMRQKGYVVQLDNGLDGTWEAQFYKPSMYGSTNEELEKTYGAGDTLLIAVSEAAKNPPNAPHEPRRADGVNREAD